MQGKRLEPPTTSPRRERSDAPLLLLLHHGPPRLRELWPETGADACSAV